MPSDAVTPFDLATVDENGVAPKSKIKSAQQAYAICSEFKRFDEPRRKKRIALYKAYKGFPPSSYSALIDEGAPWMHNINWRQLKFRIDSQKTSFTDLITEKNLIANIKTKFGKKTGEDAKYSELISEGFNLAIRGWPGYLPNKQQSLQDMLLYGVGIQLRESVEGFLPKHAKRGDFIFPDDAEIDFSNMECCVRLWRYSPNQLWDKFGDKKKENSARAVGWNRLACIEAMRNHLSSAYNKLTTEQIYHKIMQGDANVLALANKKIEVYELYVREFTGRISKHVILQEYDPVRTRNPQTIKMDVGDYMDKTGFLFTKTGMFESWDDLINPFTDSDGDTQIHEIVGFGDAIYLQCRSYDNDMNRIHDAIFINMCTMFKGDTAQATKVLREIGLRPMAVVPEDYNPIQVKFNVPIQEAMQVLQKVQADTDSGSGAYRVSNTTEGPEKTLGERQLDSAESAKLSGSQVRTFNEWETIFDKKLFFNMLKCKQGEKDYEVKKIFIEHMEDNNVPKEAYKAENITLVESNMISGAGSPSFKIMAAEKTIAVLNTVPVSKGQEEAIQDYVAALNGRSNVSRYLPDTKVDITDVQRTIAFENAGLSEAYANPANFPISPKDPQMEHIAGHLSQIKFNFDTIESLAQNQKLDKASELIHGTGNLFNHVAQHAALVSKDQTKKDGIAKQVEQALAEVKRQLDGITAQVGKMLEAQQQEQGGGMSQDDAKLKYQTAMDEIRVHTARELSNIKLADKANSHVVKQQGAQDTISTKIAGQRMLANQKAAAANGGNKIMESIQFKDLPKKAKVAMLAQVGIAVTEADFDEMDDDQAELAKASKPEPSEPENKKPAKSE